MNDVISQIMKAVERFKEDTDKNPSEVIVSGEVFAKIMPSLRGIEIDKNYSKGFLGSIEIRADRCISSDRIIVTKFPEDNFLPYEDLLPVIPPLQTAFRKHKSKQGD